MTGNIRTAFNIFGVIEPYKKDQLIFQQGIAGSYDFEVKADISAEIWSTGAGGGAAAVQSPNSAAASAGASGSVFVGWVKLLKGKYRAVIGKGGAANYGLDGDRYGGTGGATILYQILTNASGAETLSHIMTCPGGGGGHAWWRSAAAYAVLGAKPTISTEILKTTLNQQGLVGSIMSNPGAGGSGLAGTTYGKGGSTAGWGYSTMGYAGNDGYLSVTYKRLKKKYYKYIYTPLQQPRLTGNNSNPDFRVSASELNASWGAFNLFGGNNSPWHAALGSGPWIYNIQTSAPIRISSFLFTNRTDDPASVYATANVTLFGSSDAVTYENLGTVTNSLKGAGQQWTAAFRQGSKPYRYYYLSFVNNTSYMAMAEAVIMAEKASVVSGSADDYDFIEYVAL